MAKSNLNEPNRGAGRQRGSEKSQREKDLEDKAKGHEQSGGEQSNRTHQNEDVQAERADVAAKFRGNQKGFGKNQGKEAGDRSAPHGTRAEGSERGSTF